MKLFLSFVVGVAIGAASHWYFSQADSRKALLQTRDTVENKAADVGKSIKDAFDSDTIKDELSRTGQVIREKAGRAGEAISDAAANARITATIKTKLVGDSGLAAFKINVDTTDGVVTLSGTVSQYEDVAHAMRLAMDVEGVQKVISTLQVKTPVS